MNPSNPPGGSPADDADAVIRVLIFDDDAELCQTLAAIVSKLGGDPRCVGSVEELPGACDCWQPDIALIDLIMPEHDGIAVLERMGHLCTPSSIYIITGVDDQTIKSAGQVIAMSGVEVVDFLRKPLGVEDLRQIMQAQRKPDPGPS